MRSTIVLLLASFLAVSGAQAQDGRAIFQGKGNCHVCHGKDARGTPLAPDLTDTVWINIDGSPAAIRQVIVKGVDKPQKHPAPMPPMGGVKLSAKEIDALAAYIAELSKKDGDGAD